MNRSTPPFHRARNERIYMALVIGLPHRSDGCLFSLWVCFARCFFDMPAALPEREFVGRDWAGASLRDIDFQGANLGQGDFSGADLSYADLTFANLAQANLQGRHAAKANLTGGSTD
ncbi:MAG: pentapeptide repeat-containing protein [Anaerolineales bacterium]|nr:pentapeptide repeat-containing protein [Anaerolineales bacterium]